MKKYLFILAISTVILNSCGLESGNFFSDYREYSNEDVIDGDNYKGFEENPFIKTSDNPVSTFSIDADGASYSNIRRYILSENSIPPKAAVRTEELINYFTLDYPFNISDHPISLNGEVASCPWNNEHKLIRIGIKGKNIPDNQLPPSNFVFLIDVSGSMSSSDKLELLKEGFKLFVDQMSSEDRISIVTYAGSAGVLLESTSGNEKSKIKAAINKLGAGGSTAGAQGIITAYEIAQKNFIINGNNRVILGTDGDFNVGTSNTEELVKLIEEKRELKIFLTVLGVGRGNLNDNMMEQIADNGNGNYEYLDNLEQLKKVFIYEFNKFYPVAKDVKVQVEFNPELVQEYRLIGYENRVLKEEDFENDTKDAGEIGSNQSITALYEILPATTIINREKSTFTIKFRYKLPDTDTSIPINLDIYDEGNTFETSSNFMKFSASISSFSMILRDSQYKGTSNFENIKKWLKQVNLNDEHGYIDEFETMVEKASKLKK